MKVSLLLATVSRTTEVESFIRSIARDGSEPEIELVVVDQNPDERLNSIIAAIPPATMSVVHIRAPKRGLSFARNVGLEACSGDIVAFPDDDCWYESSTISEVVDWFGRNASQQAGYASWPELSMSERLPTISRRDARRFQVRLPSSIQLFFRRETIGTLKGFDESLGLGRYYGAGEETDLILRVLDREAELKPIPAARVHHLYDPASLARDFDERALTARQRGTGALYAKHALEPWVISRGFLAPVISGLLPSGSLRYGWAVSKGRVSGFRSWRAGNERV